MNMLMSIPTSRIHRSTQNPRKNFDEDKLKDLMESIREKGVIQPIIVRPRGDNFEIVCGERRMRASVLAGLTEIPAIVRELDDTEVLEVQIIENLQREDVHPMDEAGGYGELLKNLKYGSVESIAAKVGKSKGYVYGRMKLLDLVVEVQDLFYKNKLIPSTALLIARLPAELQLEAAKKIGGELEPMNFIEAKNLIIDEYMLQLKKAPFDVKKADLVPGAGVCADCPKRTGYHPDLFSDITDKKDVCTDRKCFKAKADAQKRAELAELKKRGAEIVSRKEAKNIFPYGAFYTTRGYVALDQGCDEDPKCRTYETLLRKNLDSLPVKYVEDPSGNIRKVMNAADVKKALLEVGHNFMKKADEQKSKDCEENSKNKEKTKLNRFLFDRALDEILDEVRTDKISVWMRTFAQEYLDHAWLDMEVEFVRRRDPDVKRDQARDEIQRILETLPEPEIPCFLIELAACRERASMGREMDYGDVINGLAGQYGIDLNEIEKAAKVKYESDKPKRGRKSMKDKVAEAVKAKRESVVNQKDGEAQ